MTYDPNNPLPYTEGGEHTAEAGNPAFTVQVVPIALSKEMARRHSIHSHKGVAFDDKSGDGRCWLLQIDGGSIVITELV